MSIIAKIISRTLRRKRIFFALSLLFFILNAFAASSHNNGVGITRCSYQTLFIIVIRGMNCIKTGRLQCCVEDIVDKKPSCVQ